MFGTPFYRNTKQIWKFSHETTDNKKILVLSSFRGKCPRKARGGADKRGF
jgi:hypothetical protein